MKTSGSRREFLKVTTLSAATLSLLSPFSLLAGKQTDGSKGLLGSIRIQPIAGKNYPPSFLRLCERARFHTTKQAIRAVRQNGVECMLVHA